MKIFTRNLLLFMAALGIALAALGFFALREVREDEAAKQTALRAARKVKNFIYYEATIHNPQGDMLPDNIDNSIISKLKQLLK